MEPPYNDVHPQRFAYDNYAMGRQRQERYAAEGVVTGQPQAGYGGPPPGQQGFHQQSTTNTTVVIQPTTMVQRKPRDWSSGLCECFNDLGICLYVVCCPGCYPTHISAKMNESCCLPMCVPGYLTALRTKARMQGNIQGSICNDCMATTFCYQCALCQLSREVDYMNAHPEVL